MQQMKLRIDDLNNIMQDKGKIYIIENIKFNNICFIKF